jgi:hypothetical protein
LALELDVALRLLVKNDTNVMPDELMGSYPRHTAETKREVELLAGRTVTSPQHSLNERYHLFALDFAGLYSSPDRLGPKAGIAGTVCDIKNGKGIVRVV